jgi:hypothetical protein
MEPLCSLRFQISQLIFKHGEKKSFGPLAIAFDRRRGAGIMEDILVGQSPLPGRPDDTAQIKSSSVASFSSSARSTVEKQNQAAATIFDTTPKQSEFRLPIIEYVNNLGNSQSDGTAERQTATSVHVTTSQHGLSKEGLPATNAQQQFGLNSSRSVGFSLEQALASKPKNQFEPLSKSDYQAQKSGALDANHDNPGGTPPKYPGPPHDQDKYVLRQLLKPSPLSGALYELFLETYTDRSEENRVPGSIRISELHHGVRDKVKSVELFGDSEMFQPDRHGIVLHPTGRKSPGHFYAVLRDENSYPINIIEYYQDNGVPKYLQQWIFDRKVNPNSDGQTTTISQFRESKNTAVGRPAEQNDKMVDVYMGRTEYVSGRYMGILQATAYNNRNQPVVQIDYSQQEPVMQLRDPNRGELLPAPFARAYMSSLAFSGVYLKQ